MSDAADHRDLGRELGLFTFSPLAPGMPLWLPRGVVTYNALLDRVRALNAREGYQEVRTPALWKEDLFRTSGHLDHYSANMFFVGDGPGGEQAGCLKPMNCPGHMEMFRSAGAKSYRDLPVRYAEYGLLHRNEVSGAVGGLTRCRAFCQDDAHVFCTHDQIGDEVARVVRIVRQMYGWFELPFRCVLSTRPESRMGHEADWDAAETALAAQLDGAGLTHTVQEGGGAFYGPKIDFVVTDSLGRDWQTATIQLDFQLPTKFGCRYTTAADTEATPVVIHRAVCGSFERFLAIVLEHTRGHLPLWLAPVGVLVLPVGENYSPYAKVVQIALKNAGTRAEVDDSNRPLQQKIAAGMSGKYPLLAIVGRKEQADKTVTLKSRFGQQTLPLASMREEHELRRIFDSHPAEERLET